jgi:hypothetical protein
MGEGVDKPRRGLKPERFSCLKIDNEIEFGRLYMSAFGQMADIGDWRNSRGAGIDAARAFSASITRTGI